MLKDQNERRMTANALVKKRDILFRNFLGGLAWGVGSVLGATVIVAFLVWFLQSINWVPVLGDFISQLLDVINSKKI